MLVLLLRRRDICVRFLRAVSRAPQIVQELSSRLEVLHAVNKKKVSFDVARQFQVRGREGAVAATRC